MPDKTYLYRVTEPISNGQRTMTIEVWASDPGLAEEKARAKVPQGVTFELLSMTNPTTYERAPYKGDFPTTEKGRVR